MQERCAEGPASRREASERLAREVHVYTARPGPEEEHVGRALLDGGEIRRLERLRRPADRSLYLCAHALVRSALSRYAEVPPTDWRFEAGARGRPEIVSPGRSTLRFNLSHTAGLAACVVSDGWDCGIDVESRRRRRDPLAVVDRVTSPAERAALDALPEAERRDRFLACWTLKEAYVKARGAGLALPLRHYGFALDGDGIRLEIGDPADPDRAADWQFATARPTPEHVLAVALRRGSHAPRRIVFHPDPGASWDGPPCV